MRIATVKDLKAKHPLYRKYYPEWEKYRQAYSGGFDFKNENNLRRFALDANDNSGFENLLGLLPITNMSKDLVENRVNTVYSKEPQRILAFKGVGGRDMNEEAPGLDSFLKDATLDGQSYDDFMEETCKQSSVYGHCWVWIDKAPMEEIDVTNEDQNRPYLRILLPQQVLDWTYIRVGGRDVLGHFKFIAVQERNYDIYCHAHIGSANTPTMLYAYKCYKNMKGSEQIEPFMEMALPLGMGIPAVKAFAKKDPASRLFGLSDIRDTVYTQRFLMNLDREAYESILYKKSILKLPSDVSSPEGGGLGIVRGDPEELDGVDFAVPDTADVDTIFEYQNKIIERQSRIDGLQTQTGIAARSGESFYQERFDLYRNASGKARHMEVAEAQIFDIWSKWQELQFAGIIEYDTNYSENDIEMKMTNLMKAKNIAPEDPVIQEIIKRELIKLIGDENDFRKAGIEVEEFEPVVSEHAKDVPDEPQDIITASDEEGQDSLEVSYTGSRGTIQDGVPVLPAYDNDTYIVSR